MSGNYQLTYPGNYGGVVVRGSLYRLRGCETGFAWSHSETSKCHVNVTKCGLVRGWGKYWEPLNMSIFVGFTWKALEMKLPGGSAMSHAK